MATVRLGAPGSPQSHLKPLEGYNKPPSVSLPTTPGKSNLSGPRPPPLRNVGTAPAAPQMAAADNIKVVVRIRPLADQEREKGAADVVTVSEDYSALKVVVGGPLGATMQRDFQFHACLGPDVTQQDVIQLCGIGQLLEAATAGYNVTIFAYGQTGSGKTHTMSGREEVISDDGYAGDTHDGIITRSVHHLFKLMAQQSSEAKISLRTSYLEIYNEGVFDLVHFKNKSLPVKWDAAHGFYVPDLKVVPCSSMKTMMEVIKTGMRQRRVGSHQLNMESSRSHSIMTIYCDVVPTDPSSYDYGTTRHGKISFVDLAGSEKLRDSRSEGAMLKETNSINKSLFVLGKVISALAERDANGTTAHIPYRDSKLTKLLMDSLGGSALTLMIACCSPSSLQVEETLSTLTYATRAKNIQNRPVVQYDSKESQIALLRREVELLRQENGLLREQLRIGGSGTPIAVSLHSSLPTTPDARKTPPADAGVATAGAAAALQNGRHHAMHNGTEEVVGSMDELLAGVRGGSKSPVPDAAMRRSGAMASPTSPRMSYGGGPEGAAPQQSPSKGLRSSLEAIEPRSPSRPQGPGSAPAATAGLGSSSAGGTDMIKRLKETQTLLARFSEENNRLAKENDKLRAGRNILSSEHATVLDEIDMLRGKLTQLESAVLTGAAPASLSAASAAAFAAAGSLGSSSIRSYVEDDEPASSYGSAAARGHHQQYGAPGSSGGPPLSPSLSLNSAYLPSSKYPTRTNSATGSIASTAKSIINRTPLSSRNNGDPGPEGIIVADNDKLALLFASPGAASSPYAAHAAPALQERRNYDSGSGAGYLSPTLRPEPPGSAGSSVSQSPGRLRMPPAAPKMYASPRKEIYEQQLQTKVSHRSAQYPT